MLKYITDDKYISVCAQQLTTIDACNDPDIIEQAFGGFDRDGTRYGLKGADKTLNERWARPTGVATEVYNKILSILSTQCMNLQGKFIEMQNVQDNNCLLNETVANDYNTYGTVKGENICPAGYANAVDTDSWGICSCWENGRRRSENGVTTKCVEEYKVGDKWLEAALDNENNVLNEQKKTNN